MEPIELYRIREYYGLNHEQFAAMIGATRDDIAAWEKGTFPVPAGYQLRITTELMCRSIKNKNDITGWFYVVQVAPELKPERIKFGFTKKPVERLNTHRISSPTATILKMYPCVFADETLCISSVINPNCHRLTAEAYDVDDLNRVIAACDRYFEWVTSSIDNSEYEQLLAIARSGRPQMERLAEHLARLREDWSDLH